MTLATGGSMSRARKATLAVRWGRVWGVCVCKCVFWGRGAEGLRLGAAARGRAACWARRAHRFPCALPLPRGAVCLAALTGGGLMPRAAAATQWS